MTEPYQITPDAADLMARLGLEISAGALPAPLNIEFNAHKGGACVHVWSPRDLRAWGEWLRAGELSVAEPVDRDLRITHRRYEISGELAGCPVRVFAYVPLNALAAEVATCA